MKVVKLTTEENKDDLLKKQARTIYNLQEQIRCLKFDRDEDKKIIYDLNHQNKIKQISNDLENAIKNNDIKMLKKILIGLKKGYGDSE